MSAATVTLVVPTTERQGEWLDLVGEFGGEHVPGGAFFGVTADELADPQTFADWVDDALASESGERVPEGFVGSTVRWVEQEGRLVGLVHLRHELNASLREDGGHIGYAVRPTARRRGIATAALAAMLGLARVRGIESALVTCDDDNVASARTIEANGGVLAAVRAGKRYYWVPTTA